MTSIKIRPPRPRVPRTPLPVRPNEIGGQLTPLSERVGNRFRGGGGFGAAVDLVRKSLGGSKTFTPKEVFRGYRRLP